MKNSRGQSQSQNHRIDEFSLQGRVPAPPENDESVSSGFVISPENESVSIITDDFDPSVSSGISDDTPLAQIIGRLNIFGRHSKKRTFSKDSKVSFDASQNAGDKFMVNPKKPMMYPTEVRTDGNGMVEVGLGDVIDLGNRPCSPVRRAYRRRQVTPSFVEMSNLSQEEREMQRLGSREVLDFTADEPASMTYGRRIALRLKSKRWYNPNSKKVQPIEDADHKPQAQAEFENFHDDNNNHNRIQDGPSLERAWGYFEHVTLPRYMNDLYSDFPAGCCDRISLLKKTLEKAEKGERYIKTKLYDPIFTALEQMGDFGLGIGLYFASLRAVAIVTFLAGLVSLPNILYFSGADYSNGQDGVLWALKGSAICTNATYVPCVDCTEQMFRDDASRFQYFSNAEGEELPFALKNHCEAAKFTVGLCNFGAAIVVILGMVVSSFSLRNMEVEFDEDAQTAADYSIKIINPPDDAHDANEWRIFFRKNFRSQVSICTIVVDNDRLVHKLVHRRELLQKIKSIVGPKESLKEDNLKKLSSAIKIKRSCVREVWAKLFSGVPEYYAKIQACDEEIRDIASEKKAVTSVFVTFESEAAQRKVLTIMNTEDGYKKKYCFRGDKFLKVIEPAEPSGIRWNDVDVPDSTFYGSLVAPFVITIGLIAASAFLFVAIRKYRTSQQGAFAIALANYFFPLIAKALTDFEKHRNHGSRQTSLYVKITFFRWINTAIIITIVTPFTSTIANGENGVLSGIYAIFFAEIVTCTVIQLLDISGNFKRHYFAPRQKTQEDMNQCMSGAGVELAERYTNMTKQLFLALWYCPIYPGALFLCSFSLFVNYYLDRFSLMRTWKPAPKLNSSISKINRSYFVPATIGIMAVIASFTWSQLNFDNLCIVESSTESYIGKWTAIESNTFIESIKIVDNDTTSYKYCNQDMLNWDTPFAFPALPNFQPSEGRWMTGEQESLAQIWAWTSVAILAFVFTFFLISIKHFLSAPFQPKGIVSDVQLTDLKNLYAYIPEVESPEVPFPLVACSVAAVDPHLFGWSSPRHGHEYYDLTLDAERIMEGDKKGRNMDEHSFSKLVQWIHTTHVS